MLLPHRRWKDPMTAVIAIALSARPPLAAAGRGHRMNATAVPSAPGKLAAESRWAVETHGLTKRFGAKLP